jgi:hypothetical protein
MDAAGDAVVLWQRLYDPDGAGAGVATWVMETNERSAGGSFSLGGVQSRSSLTQSDGSTYIGAYSCTYDVAMTPAGRTLAIWDYANGGTAQGSKFVEYADRVGSSFDTGSWSARARASLPTQDAQVPFVALDDAGNGVATWSAFDGSNWGVQSSTRQGQGAWGTRTDLSGPGGGAFQSSIASSPGGDAVIVWPGNSGANTAIFGARRRPGTDFSGIGTAVVGQASGSPTTSYGTPSVALDDQGNGFVAFQRTVNNGANSYTLQVAGIDPVAPQLSALSVPGSGSVGAPVGMSAQAFDRMSGAAISWNFGDGTGATGGSVSHAYGAPGAYTVTVTARDGANNQTSQSRTISIVSGGGIDADGDGFFAGQDCNDNNAKINPTAKEIRGNNIDENCDGVALGLPDLRSSVLPLWSVSGKRATIVGFTLKGLKRGWKVTASCKGSGCPFKSRKITNKKTKKGNLNALKKLGSKRTFAVGQTLTVKFTAPGYNTKFSIFKFKAGKLPNGVARCQTKGSSKLRACH